MPFQWDNQRNHPHQPISSHDIMDGPNQGHPTWQNSRSRWNDSRTQNQNWVTTKRRIQGAKFDGQKG